MAKKAGPGRPPGSQNKVGKDQKEFIKGLLGDTQEEFRNAFMYYAKQSDKNIEDRNKFINLSVELSKMIVPKPVEIDATMNVDDFQVLLGQCTKWDDEQ
jgi:hypothetical protein